MEKFKYSELIDEFSDDLTALEIGEDETIEIVRGKEINGYRPIIDWYFKDSNIQEEDIGNTETINAYEALKEMIIHNRL